MRRSAAPSRRFEPPKTAKSNLEILSLLGSVQSDDGLFVASTVGSMKRPHQTDPASVSLIRTSPVLNSILMPSPGSNSLSSSTIPRSSPGSNSLSSSTIPRSSPGSNSLSSSTIPRSSPGSNSLSSSTIPRSSPGSNSLSSSTIPRSSPGSNFLSSRLVSKSNCLPTYPTPHTDNSIPKTNCSNPQTNYSNTKTSYSTNSIEDGSTRYFSCVWCKKSGRKHKKWEGDGLIKVGCRTITLVDEGGKELGRGSGYKVADLEALEDGSQICVGSKEVELSGTISEDLWRAKIDLGRNKENAGANTEEPKHKGKKRKIRETENTEEDSSAMSLVLNSVLAKEKFRPFKIPRRTGGEEFVAARPVAPGVPMFDPGREGVVVLPRPPVGHALRTSNFVDVVLDPYIGSKLRPHQRSGFIFLYSNLMGFKTFHTEVGEFQIKGAILADDMGLGKTLQSIALVWTLLKQSPVAGSVLVKRVLIVAPTSLLNNWAAEFRKWLGSERIVVHIADSAKKVSVFKSYHTAPVLLVSYEMLVRAEAELREIKWDLVVCDEAHRLKNSEIKTSSCLARLGCDRKVLLTGTPVQNDLSEYYCLVSAVAPGILGPKNLFNSHFVTPIEKGREPGASEEEVEEANSALARLAEVSRHILLRRTSEIISQYLPPKTVNVVFCRPSEFQAAVYSREVEALLDRAEGEQGAHLAAIARLKKICSSPYLVDNLDMRGVPAPATWEEQSGKLSALTCMLLTLAETSDERIVLVSLSTSTLDLLASLCDRYNLPAVRLDGKTPPASRQQIVNSFNSAGSSARVFLLSSKAGGTGLNLIGASRIVLFDIDWNPATDMQAMARIWRCGQKRHCHIYRLVTTGTIEEKIYQRQVMKSGLACGLEVAGLGAAAESAAAFTGEELRNLFTFSGETESETHDLLDCECGGSGELQGDSAVLPQDQRPRQLGGSRQAERCGSNMEQLKMWRHYTSPIYGKVEDHCLGAAESFVSYLFSHYQDSTETKETGNLKIPPVLM